jgi:hypothetical protein
VKKLLVAAIILSSLMLFARSKARCTESMSGSKQLSAPVFTAPGFTFFGVDYSQVRLIGDHGHGAGTNLDPAHIRDKYFNALNELVFNEKKKYDFKKATGGKKITYDFNSVAKINLTADPAKMRSFSEHTPLTTQKLRGMVKKYEITTSPNNIGMVLIADKMDRVEVEAYYYVVFFNVADRSVLFYAYVKGKPKGMGYRNYWAGSIYSVIKDMSKYDWKHWESVVMK